MRAGLALFVFVAACTADNPNYLGPGTDAFSGDGLITTGDMAKPGQDLSDRDLTGQPPEDLSDPGFDGSIDCLDEGAACAVSSTTAGLCKLGKCSPCADPDDDGLCSFAYGGDRLCLKGSCVPGNCRSSEDCLGKLCAGTLCVPCSGDGQCQNDPTYGNDSTCDEDVGLCVDDNACPPAVGNVFVVDPDNGDDGDGSGNGAVAGCAFRTISHALAVLPGTPAVGTTILVRGNPADAPTDLDGDEEYPLVIPTNVTVTIEDGSPDIRVAPDARYPFTLAGKNIRLGGNTTARFLIDGSDSPFGEKSGITSQNGTTAIVDHLQIANYGGQQGIGLQLVSGAVVALGEAVEINNCTTGIRVNGRNNGAPQIGHLTVSHPDDLAGEGLYVHDNSVGLSVIGLGYVSLLGEPQTATIRFVDNSAAGISITQTASNNLNENTIDGVQARGPGTAGISVQFGSRVKLRRTEMLGASTGLVLTVGFGVTSAPDPSQIDLGTGGDPGYNTFQHPSLPNSNTGICVLAVSAPSSAIKARGNTWNALDCASPNPGSLVVADNKSCSGGADVGYQLGNLGPELSKVYDVQNCDL